MQNINGCDSIIGLILSVNPVSKTQLSASIYQGESYNFFGRLLTTEGVHYHNLLNIHGCDSIFELTLSVNPFISVDSIINVPTTTMINVPLTLTGTVLPINAMNKDIVWSVANAGTTGATIIDNELFASSEGTAFIKATIKNGKAIGEDFEKGFTITVSSVGVQQLRITNLSQSNDRGIDN